MHIRLRMFLRHHNHIKPNTDLGFVLVGVLLVAFLFHFKNKDGEAYNTCGDGSGTSPLHSHLTNFLDTYSSLLDTKSISTIGIVRPAL